MIPIRSSNQLPATYCKLSLPQYNDNPLISALGPILSEDETSKLLRRKPDFDKQLLARLTPDERIHYMQDISRIVLPLSANRKFARMFSLMIRQGYLARNPLDPAFNQRIAAFDELSKEMHTLADKGKLHDSPSGGLLMGMSGLGKTSILATTLDLYPNGLLIHTKFNDKVINQVQVPTIVVECSHDASVKGLVEIVLAELGRIVGERLFDGLKRSYNTTTLIRHTVRHLLNYSVGAVVIDEAEFVTAKFSGGDKSLLFFWINLMNTAGIPLVLVANPEFEEVTKKWLKAGLRFCSGGNMYLYNLPPDGEWVAFMQGIWPYQYTKKFTPLSEELLAAFYECSQGIIKLSLMLYKWTQEAAILEGKDETLTPEMVQRVLEEKGSSLRPLLDQLMENSTDSFAESEDLGRVRPLSELELELAKQNGASVPSTGEPNTEKKEEAPRNPNIRRGKLAPTGLLSYLLPEVRGELSVVAAMRRDGLVRQSTEFWRC